MQLRYVYPNVMTYPKLRQLSLDLEAADYDNFSMESDLMDMFSSNPSLVQLHLRATRTRLGPALWSSLSTLPDLRILYLEGGRLDTEDSVIAFQDLCMKLTDVDLSETVFPPKGSYRLMTSTAPQPKIRTLRLGGIEMDVTDQFALFDQCSQLQDFTWELYSSVSSTGFQQFAQRVASGTWPNLENLKLLDLGEGVGPEGEILEGHMVQDDDAARILKSLQRVVVLFMPHSKFGLHAFQPLRQHFGTLTELKFRDCSAVTSAMLLEILHSCSQLEALYGDTIRAKDVAEGGPWRCLALETLIVHFEFLETEQDLQPLIFGRLSALTRLQLLFVDSDSEPPGSYPNGLDFRLQSGLGALATLKRINLVSYTQNWQEIGVQDIQWIVSNWKELTCFYG